MKNTQRVAIITGGARGIGKAIAQKFIAEGIKVMICSRHAQEVKQTLRDLNSKGKLCKGLVIDVSKEAECKKLIRMTLKTFGRIDILVNNAGIYGDIGFLEAGSSAEWEKAFLINVFGMMYCTKSVLPYMKKLGSGKIINLAGAGVGGKKPLPRFSSYYVSKAAVVAFTEVIAAEVAENNIQVNCVSPGAVNTFFTDYLLSQGEVKAGKEMYAQATKQKKSGGDSPTLTADMAAFLASEESNHITGRMISAKWENKNSLLKLKPFSKSLYKLRRVDDFFFYEKKS